MITRFVAVLATIGLVGPCFAGDLAALAEKAEAQESAGKHVEAIQSLRSALDVLTARSPLLLQHVQFVAEPPRGYGIYQPRASNVFKAGEPLIVYAEPVGMGWKKADGVNRARVVTDFEIRTRDGKILGGQRDFGRFEFASRERNQEVMTHLTINLTGAPSGSYVFAATYRDQVTGKSASMELPFDIR